MSKRIALNIVINFIIVLISPSSFAGVIADNKAINASSSPTGISPDIKPLIDPSLTDPRVNFR